MKCVTEFIQTLLRQSSQRLSDRFSQACDSGQHHSEPRHTQLFMPCQAPSNLRSLALVIGLDRTTDGFTPRVGVFWAQLEDVRRETLRYVARLEPQQLSWTPQKNVESIGTLLLHIAAVERSWIGEDIDRRPMGEEWMIAFPIRFGIEQIHSQPLEHFLKELARTRDETRTVLSALTDDDLSRDITPLDPGESTETYTIEWILHHLVEHEAHHRGQIALLKRLYVKHHQHEV